MRVRKGERVYPLTGVRIAEDVQNIAQSREELITLAKWFTSNQEGQTDEALLKEVSGKNLSERRYELLFIRWTDALAVYDKSVGGDYETALFRAGLVYETAIIVRRLLRSLSDRMDTTAASLRAYLPNPWIVNRRLESLARIRTAYVTLLPIQSNEARRLLQASYDAFELSSLVTHTTEKARILDVRLQWMKTQFVVTIGLVAYIMDKLGIFGVIKTLLHLSPLK